MRKKHRRVLIGASVVVVVLGAIYIISLTKAQARLSRAYAALEADGRPMQAAEVIPASIAEAENAAPLFVAAAHPLKEQASGIRDLLDRLQTLSSRFLGGSIKPEDLEELKGYLAQDMVTSSLKLFEQGLQRPACRFLRDYDQGLLGDLREPEDVRSQTRWWSREVNDIRSLLWIRWAQARLQAGDESINGAWDRVFTQFRLVKALEPDPCFRNQLDRCSMARRGCTLIQNLCLTDPPDEQPYQQLQSLLADLDDVTPLLRGLDGERLFRGEWLFKLPMDELYETLRPSRLLGRGSEASARLSFARLKFKPSLVADHAAYLEAIHKSAQIIQAPYDPNSPHWLPDLADGSKLACMLLPFGDTGKRWHCSMMATAHITRAGLALLQYKQAHGAYPAGLDALDLEDLVDPFSEKPLLYRAEGESFSVYSVGENLQDNKGKPWQRGHQEYDDIAWHFPPLSM